MRFLFEGRASSNVCRLSKRPMQCFPYSQPWPQQMLPPHNPLQYSMPNAMPPHVERLSWA
eukprot:7344747-Prymnesium_polylepis.2